jgi:L-ascorbate metabolism protein UlaG (beta-lactamase superfamily)
MRRLAALALLLASTTCKKEDAAGTAPSATHAPPPSAFASVSEGPPAADAAPSRAGARPPSDVISGAGGDIRVTPIHHATLLLEVDGRALYFDPVHDARYDGLPKAHLVFITDIHADHMDVAGIEAVKQPLTMIVAPPAVAEKLPKDIGRVTVLANGEKKAIASDADNNWGVTVEAIPMYNVTRGPSPGKLFHDKGRGDGFVLTLDGKRFYVSGDTECIPEMKALENIDVAFVCMNLPYTMPPGEAAECVNAFKPKVVYPYHYRQSNLDEFTHAITPGSGVEVRRRDWYAP